MRFSQRLVSRLALLSGLAFLAACADGPPVEPGDLDGPSFAAAGDGSDVTPTSEHVVLMGGKIPGDFAERVAALGGSVVRTHPEIGVALVTGLTDNAAARLANGPGIQAAPRDVMVQFIPTAEELNASVEALPTDFTPQAHDPTTAFFFPFQWDMQIIDADDAWNAGFSGSPTIRVAILDTGIDPFHPDLAGLVDAASSIAFIPAVNGPPAWVDDNFHGTHVAGTVVTNGIGTSGVAPHTTLIAVKVLSVFGGGSFGSVIAGIVHAANVGADVINMSLAGGFPKNVPGGGQLVAALNRAVNYANRNGVFVASAAANAGADLDHNKNFTVVPCESGTGSCISATGPTDALASYSNFGTSAIDVAGPGGDFVVTGNPFSSMVLSPCSTRSVFFPICASGNFYLFAQGTSMASPHVAGAAALLDAQHGGSLEASQLEAQLRQTADDLGKKGTDPQFGKGRINVCRLVAC